MDLTPWLEDIERRIDETDETAVYEAWKAFAMGDIPEGEAFCPPRRKSRESRLEWKHININVWFN